MELRELVNGILKTQLLYLKDSYLQKLEANVLGVQLEKKNGIYIMLNKTIFHPQSGGQPSDVGTISSSKIFKILIKKAMMVDGVVIHWGKIAEGKPESKEVQCEIEWSQRYTYMKRHTASHLLDHCLNIVSGRTMETFGSWLGSPCYVGYKGDSPPLEVIVEAVRMVNEAVKIGCKVEVETVPRDELARRAPEAPNIYRLPSLDFYRIVTISGCDPIPCAGTHVKDIQEIGQIKLISIQKDDSQFKVYYDIQ